MVRDYFVAHNERAGHVWVFRERTPSAPPSAEGGAAHPAAPLVFARHLWLKAPHAARPATAGAARLMPSCTASPTSAFSAAHRTRTSWWSALPPWLPRTGADGRMLGGRRGARPCACQGAGLHLIMGSEFACPAFGWWRWRAMQEAGFLCQFITTTCGAGAARRQVTRWGPLE